MTTDSPQYAAFISHAKTDAPSDAETAQKICAGLEQRGLRCWIAPRDVTPGREYADEIMLGIERSQCLVLVFSEAANRSKFVRREVERAVTKAKPVFTVRIQDAHPTGALELLVASTQWVEPWNDPLTTRIDRLATYLSDERTTEARSQESRRIRRERRFSKLLVAGVACIAVVAAIVAVNAFWRPEPGTNLNASNGSVSSPTLTPTPTNTATPTHPSSATSTATATATGTSTRPPPIAPTATSTSTGKLFRVPSGAQVFFFEGTDVGRYVQTPLEGALIFEGKRRFQLRFESLNETLWVDPDKLEPIPNNRLP